MGRYGHNLLIYSIEPVTASFGIGSEGLGVNHFRVFDVIFWYGEILNNTPSSVAVMPASNGISANRVQTAVLNINSMIESVTVRRCD